MYIRVLIVPDIYGISLTRNLYLQLKRKHEDAVKERDGVTGKLALLEEVRKRLIDQLTTAEQKITETGKVSVVKGRQMCLFFW